MLSALILLPGYVKAESQNLSLNTVLDGILQSQGAASVSVIDCSKVTDTQLETLGDAYMGTMHPDANEHELIDNMMGGEGSAQLTASHIYMGSQYLGCYNGQRYNQGFGMMGGLNMMNGGFSSYPYTNMMGFNNMMLGSNIFSLWNIIFFGLLLFLGVIVILGVVLMLKFFGNKASGVQPMDILKQRYAKGEITREQFEKLKEELK